MRCKACNTVYQPIDIEIEDGSTVVEECCPECVFLSLDDSYELEDTEIKFDGESFKIYDIELYYL